MTNLDNILKSRDITLPTKVCIVTATVFPVVMYGCESWTVKKAEGRRTDAFELWCWRILFRVPWTARRSNQSILKEISPEYSLEGLMLKLKHQYFGHLRKTSIPALLTVPKPLNMWITINCGKFWKRWEYQTTWPASWETHMQVRKQQLELDMEQQTGSK